MSDESPINCPICGAKYQEMEGLIQRMNDQSAALLRERYIQKRLAYSLAICNMMFLLYLIWTHV